MSERAKDNWKVEWSRFDFLSSSSPSSHSPLDRIDVRWTVYKNIIRLKISLHLTIFLLDVLHCLSIMSFSHFSLCCVFQFYFITWGGGRRRNFLACGSAFWSYWFFSLVILFTKGVEFHTFLNLYVRWNFMAWINHEKNSHKSNIDGIKKNSVGFKIALILWMILLKVFRNILNLLIDWFLWI